MTKTINFKIDWLVLFILILPTFYMVGQEPRHVQMNFFQISIISLVALFHVNRYIGIFLAWCAFQFVFFKGIPTASLILQNIFFGAILYHFVVKYSNPSKKYLWAMYSVLVLSVLWIPLQIKGIDPIFSMANPQMQTKMTEYPGFFNLPAIMGNYASAVAPLALVLNPALSVITLVALFFSKSSFSVLAGLIGVLFFYWFRKRLVFWILLVLLGGSSLFYVIKFDMPSGQFGRRFGVWKIITEQALRSQFFGYGIGSYGNTYHFIESSPSLKNIEVTNNKEMMIFLVKEAMAQKKPELVNYLMSQDLNRIDEEDLSKNLQKNGMDMHEWKPAHNEFLQVFFESGIIGLLTILAFIFNLFRRFFKAGLQNNFLALSLLSSFLAICVISFAHFPFHLARTGGVFLVIIALLETCILRSEE